ncbi:hydrogenase maturation protease [Clostridium manihotivorum]|uniref:Hydrogenase maturation protease n=1 Tax=Clostridium manihotivorum TaxID=2320868 RepID=A0A410DZJ0_9CLOT|nr:hydrogenase maturation protease [Clostridium manihotivorum]QAA34463.1 hydrogenase maturation protease [Clostridium manihotivorum]
MRFKLIAIGNILMGDDGVALKIVDCIEERLKLSSFDLTCVKAETDFDFALDHIEDGDYVFILDSTSLGEYYGQITLLSLQDAKRYCDNVELIHNFSLISLINKADVNVNGTIIGIKIAKVSFDLELSEELKKKFNAICNEVYSIIESQCMRLGESYA